MKSNNYLFIAFFFIFCQINLYAGGLSAWTENTPYGHEIYHDGSADATITLSVDTTSVSFKHFYFYKGYTIANSDSDYFIINEKTNKIEEYKDQKIWKSKLEERNLVPYIQRDYDANYSSAFGSGIIFLLLFLPFPLLLPLLWLICLISLAFSTRKFYTFRKYFSWIYPLIIAVVLVFEVFPQSI